jgi:ABC-type lipoprotein release transport system permease subunit
MAALVNRAAAGQVLGSQATPILVFVGEIMVASGLVAAMGPARRALGVQPMEALKAE